MDNKIIIPHAHKNCYNVLAQEFTPQNSSWLCIYIATLVFKDACMHSYLHLPSQSRRIAMTVCTTVSLSSFYSHLYNEHMAYSNYIRIVVKSKYQLDQVVNRNTYI